MAAFMETSVRCNVEFLRASGGSAGRVIRFNHTPEIVPGQLQGRVTPEEWASFMADCDTLAKHHPYVQKPGAKKICGWAACLAIGSIVGLCVVDPDAGDYGAWEQEARDVVAKHQAMFAKAGCTAALQRQRDYYIQIDVDPSKAPIVPVAAGVPPPAGKPGQPPPSPFESVAP